MDNTTDAFNEEVEVVDFSFTIMEEVKVSKVFSKFMFDEEVSYKVSDNMIEGTCNISMELDNIITGGVFFM